MPDTTEDMVEDRISCFVTSAYVVESDEDVFKIGTLLESFFFYQAKALLAKFLRKENKRKDSQFKTRNG